MKIELLTEAHYIALHGEPPVSTVKGVVITDDQEVMAICCMSLINGENFVIYGGKENVNRRLVIKAWKVFCEMMSDGKTYYALIDKGISTAEVFVNHFGFVPFKDDIYVYRGG